MRVYLMLSGRCAGVNGTNTTVAVALARIVAELSRRFAGMFPARHAGALQLHNPPITLTWPYRSMLAIGDGAHKRVVNKSIL
jgi:hypothetical protein